jgi:hypothetical protein
MDELDVRHDQTEGSHGSMMKGARGWKTKGTSTELPRKSNTFTKNLKGKARFLMIIPHTSATVSQGLNCSPPSLKRIALVDLCKGSFNEHEKRVCHFQSKNLRHEHRKSNSNCAIIGRNASYPCIR